MIRILHVLGGLDCGGAETMVMNLYRNMNRETIQFDFIIHTEKKQAYYEEILELGGRIYHSPSIKKTSVVNLKRWWTCFFKEHSEYRILHSHVRSYASIYLPIAKKHGLKTIIHSHSTSNGKGLQALVKNILQYPLRYQADWFFSCSIDAGKWLFGKKIANSNRHVVLKNAIDTKKFQFREDVRRKYRTMLSLDDKLVYIHVGRFHPAKNHNFLLRLFAKLHQLQRNSKLVLVGDGELRSSIEKQISELNLKDAVLLLGSRSDIPNLLQAADAFLFPSAWEGLPVTVVEAQAAGLPCFISDTITEEVDLSDLVIRLPIDKDIDVWTRELCDSNLNRKDVCQNIALAGFEIKESAKTLSDFYVVQQKELNASNG